MQVNVQSWLIRRRALYIFLFLLHFRVIDHRKLSFYTNCNEWFWIAAECSLKNLFLFLWRWLIFIWEAWFGMRWKAVELILYESCRNLNAKIFNIRLFKIHMSCLPFSRLIAFKTKFALVYTSRSYLQLCFLSLCHLLLTERVT